MVIADRVEEATILFADLVGFTAAASRVTPAVLVNNLNRIFSAFDELCRQLQIEKIKTIGDAYMAAAGVPLPRPDHAEVMADFALAMLAALERVNAAAEVPFQMRIGIHTGPVVAGVIGSHRFLYDIWGDTVNLASRLESHGLPGRDPRLTADQPDAGRPLRARGARPDQPKRHWQDQNRVPHRQERRRPAAISRARAAGRAQRMSRATVILGWLSSAPADGHARRADAITACAAPVSPHLVDDENPNTRRWIRC